MNKQLTPERSRKDNFYFVSVGNAGSKQLVVAAGKVQEAVSQKWIKDDSISFLDINTDGQRSGNNKPELGIQHFVLGPKLCESQGTGMRPEIGKLAFQESEADLRAQFKGIRYVVLMFAWGGGTGEGAGPEIYSMLVNMGIVVFGMFIMPAKHEVRPHRMRQILDKQEALKQLGLPFFQPLNERAGKLNRSTTKQKGWDTITPDIAFACVGIAKVVQELQNPLVDVDLNDIRNLLLHGADRLLAGNCVFTEHVGDALNFLTQNKYYEYEKGQDKGAILVLVGDKWTAEMEQKLLVGLERKLDPKGINERLLLKVARCPAVKDGKNFAVLLRASYRADSETLPLPYVWWTNKDGQPPTRPIYFSVPSPTAPMQPVPPTQIPEGTLLGLLAVATSRKFSDEQQNDAKEILAQSEIDPTVLESVESDAVKAVELLIKETLPTVVIGKDLPPSSVQLGARLREELAKAYFEQRPLPGAVNIRMKAAGPDSAALLILRPNTVLGQLKGADNFGIKSELMKESQAGIEERKQLFAIFGEQLMAEIASTAGQPRQSGANSYGSSNGSATTKAVDVSAASH